MSLVIEGIKMPEYRDVFGDRRGCVYLLMLTVNKDSTASMQFNDVDGGFYRVKEIPTPHGRLIDADRLMEVIEKNSYLLKGYYNSLENGMFLTGIKQAIDEAPAIIEAEVNE